MQAGAEADAEVHIALAEALLACNELPAAQAQWAAAEAVAKSDETRRLARAALADIAAKLGETGSDNTRPAIAV